MTTKAEAVQSAAERLKLVAVGQSVPSEYDSVLNDGYDEVYEDLEYRSLTTWLDTDPMPKNISRWFVDMMCVCKLPVLGASDAVKRDLYASVGVDGYEGVKQIRRRLRPSYSSQDEPVDY